jgi:hypothetical protein
MTLAKRVETYFEGRNTGCIVPFDSVCALAVAAARFYCGYADIEDRAGVSLGANITDSEWAIIGPLFRLYVDREQALQLESARIMGIDSFGRASSEVEADIRMEEDELPRKAFSMIVVSV